MMDFPKPNIVVSKCLGFAECRYNGVTIKDDIIDSLKGFVNFITVCPEEEIGLGTPRKPLRLVESSKLIKLVQPSTKKDFTDEMNKFSEKFISKLDEVDGFILKSRSPSCGLADVKVYLNLTEPYNERKGVGIFAKSLKQNYLPLPMEDEGRLKNFIIRENFFKKIFTLAYLRKVLRENEFSSLIDFHTRNKLLFRSFDSNIVNELGRLVAEKTDPILYKTKLLTLFRSTPSVNNWIDTIQHAYAGLKNNLSKDERDFFIEKVEEYRDERIPLSSLINLIESWAIRFDNKYLLDQTFINPYPKELHKVLDSGKGV